MPTCPKCDHRFSEKPTRYVVIQAREPIHVLDEDSVDEHYGRTMCGKFVDISRDHVTEELPRGVMCKICQRIKPAEMMNPNQKGLFDDGITESEVNS